MMRVSKFGEWDQQQGFARKRTEFIADKHPHPHWTGDGRPLRPLGSGTAEPQRAEHERWIGFYLKTW
jgi:hypothetical protein